VILSGQLVQLPSDPVHALMSANTDRTTASLNIFLNVFKIAILPVLAGGGGGRAVSCKEIVSIGFFG
jgi:hypothetical protein